VYADRQDVGGVVNMTGYNKGLRDGMMIAYVLALIAYVIHVYTHISYVSMVVGGIVGVIILNWREADD